MHSRGFSLCCCRQSCRSLQQGAEKVPAGEERASNGAPISSFRRSLDRQFPGRAPESRAFPNLLIFKAKHWTPAFAGVTVSRCF